MTSKPLQKRIWKICLLTFLPCSVVALNFLDPINWPKQIALLAVLPFLFAEIFKISGFNHQVNYKLRLLILTSLVLFTISAMSNFENLTRVLWGSWGRSNGLVTFASLLIVCYVFALISQVPKSPIILIRSLSIAFMPATLYGLVQSFLTDPINWSAKGQVFSFFGNPNFASSILAVSAVASFYSYIISVNSLSKNIFLFQTLASIVVVWNTKSIQGLVVIALSVALGLYFLVVSRGYAKAIVAFPLIALSGLIVFLGFLGKGPLGQFLFQYPMQLRQYYWSTGLKMGFSQPLIGVGIDSYGDYYRTYRTFQIAKITSVDLTVDNAHNSLIQIFATLGLIGVAGYLLLVIPAIISLFKFILNPSANKSSWAVTSLFFGTFAISMISIDNIAVAIVNWALIGFFLGSFLGNGIRVESENPNQLVEKKLTHSKEAATPIIVWLIALAVFGAGWTASQSDRELIRIFNTPANTNEQASIDNRWKSLNALATKNSNTQEAHYRYISDGIKATNVWPVALEVTQSGLKKYPRDFLLFDRAAVLAENLGKFDLAEKYRNKQLEMDPRHALVWLYLARSQYEQGKLEEAKESIKNSREYQDLLDDNGISYMKTLEDKMNN